MSDEVGIEYKSVGSSENDYVDKNVQFYTGMPKGWKLGQNGTTIYKTKREDKEVEAVLGVKKYEPRAIIDRNAELESQNRTLSEQVKELQGQMQVMLAAIAQNQTVANNATVESAAPKRTRKKEAE